MRSTLTGTPSTVVVERIHLTVREEIVAVCRRGGVGHKPSSFPPPPVGVRAGGDRESRHSGPRPRGGSQRQSPPVTSGEGAPRCRGLRARSPWGAFTGGGGRGLSLSAAAGACARLS